MFEIKFDHHNPNKFKTKFQTHYQVVTKPSLKKKKKKKSGYNALNISHDQVSKNLDFIFLSFATPTKTQLHYCQWKIRM
jgi:hypothetical protein